MLRDTQVLPIWEGTTNVLALDAMLRGDAASGLRALIERVAQCRSLVSDARLAELAAQAAAALDHVVEWLGRNGEAMSLQAGARRVAMTIGRAWQLMLLIEHAQWELDSASDRTGIAAASRFAASPVDLLATIPLEDSRSLLR